MFGKFMNNYYYGKSGKGDYQKDDLPRTRWQLFWEMLRVRFAGLFRLNIVSVIAWLPAMYVLIQLMSNLFNIAGVAQKVEMDPSAATPEQLELVQNLRPLYNSVIMRSLLLLVPAIAITGPFQAGMAYVTRNWARDEHAFVWSDFKDALIGNWKQSLVISFITGLVPLIVYVGYQFYGVETEKIYEIANRILRKNGKMVLFAQQPFTTELISKQIPNLPFNYSMIWKKDHFANSLIAKKAPLNYYEDVLVFSKTHDFEGIHPLRPYFKMVLEFIGLNKKAVVETIGQSADHCFRVDSSQFSLCTEKTYNKLIEIYDIDKMQGFRTFESISNESDGLTSTFNLWEGGKFKSNILEYKKDYDGLHPTQKPILLLEDLLKTFSNENDLVVDLTMGSGSTAIACMNTNRNFIGIEKDFNYFDVSKKRVEKKRKEKDLQAETLFGNEM